MAFSQIQPTQTEAKAVIDEQLMDTGLRLNFDDHESRLLAVEAAVGTAGEVSVEDLFADILTDKRFFSNEGILFKRRYHASTTKNDARISAKAFDKDSGGDIEGDDKEVRVMFKHEYDDLIQGGVDSNLLYKGASVVMIDGAEILFKVKRGENFFGIGTRVNPGHSDTIEILIDGQTPVSLSLVDQNGNAAPNSFSNNGSIDRPGTVFYYFDLDGEEHIVSIKNNDSLSRPTEFEFVEIGYRSRDYSITNDLHINKSKALVKGVQVDIAEQDVSFTKSTGYGHSGMLVSNTSGVVRVVDGLEGAMTHVKSDETIDFTSAVTTIPVKTAFNFPDKGICLFQHPLGGTFQFSYGSKTTTTVQTNSLDDIIWKLQPVNSLDIETGFNNQAATGDAKINATITYWAEPTIEINSGNNKIDFEITITDSAGVDQTTSHTATIPSGWYDAEIINIADTIVQQMEAVKPLGTDGRYYAEWQSGIKKWVIGASGKNIVSIAFDFATGANFASSIHPTLGYNNADISGDNAYYANNETTHRPVRAYYGDKFTRSPDSQDVKYTTSNVSATPENPDVESRLGFDNVRPMSDGNEVNMQIHTDDDSCGIIAYFVTRNNNTGVSMYYQIDDRERTYMFYNQQYGFNNVSDGIYGRVIPVILTYPRGSKKICFGDTRVNMFTNRSGGVNTISQIQFAGYKQLYSRPKIEDVASDENILRVYDIAPKSLYSTTYGNNSGVLYSPGSNDSINTVTETGSWAAAGPSDFWNQFGRITTSSGDFVEYDFTINGDCGGIWLRVICTTSTPEGVEFYLSTSAINESTDLISTTCFLSQTGPISDGADGIGMYGIPQGTYKARFKLSATTSPNFVVLGVTVADTIPPDVNTYVIADTTNNGQTVPRALFGKYNTVLGNANDRVLNSMRNSQYKFGYPTDVHTSGSFSNADHSGNEQYSFGIARSRKHYGNSLLFAQNEYCETISMCKSITIQHSTFTSYSTIITSFIDGVATPNTTTARQAGKNGAANNSIESTAEAVFKRFEFEGITMTGKVVSITDTRGLRVGEPILLVDNVGAVEQKNITSIVVGVSVTVDTPLTVLTDSNVVAIRYHGIHTSRYRNDDASSSFVSNFIVEPLDVQPSNFKKRNLQGTVLETAITRQTIANTETISLPVFSDGEIARQREVSLSMLSSDGASYSWEDFPIYSGGGARVKLVARRLVPGNILDFDWEY